MLEHIRLHPSHGPTIVPVPLLVFLTILSEGFVLSIAENVFVLTCKMCPLCKDNLVKKKNTCREYNFFLHLHLRVFFLKMLRDLQVSEIKINHKEYIFG